MAKKNSEYWEERIANKTWDLYNDLENKNKILKDFYEESLLDLEEEIYKTFMKISNGTPTLSDIHKYNRLNKLKKNMDNIIKSLAKEIKGFGKEQFFEAYKKHYKTIMLQLGEEDFSLPNKKLMEKILEYPWSGEDFSERLWNNMKHLETQLNDILVRGLVQGKSFAEMTKELQDRMQKGLNECHRLIRTETMNMLCQSSLEAYKEAKVKKVQFWAALDERTCPICGRLHGKVFNIDEVVTSVQHPNCRCTLLPVVNV